MMHNCRPCILADIPWLLSVSKKNYPDLFKNEQACKIWAENIMGKKGILFIRNDYAFIMGHYGPCFYDEKIRGELKLIAGTAKGLISLMFYVKNIGAQFGIEWEFKSSTKNSLRKLAKIVGAKEVHPTFVMEVK